MDDVTMVIMMLLLLFDGDNEEKDIGMWYREAAAHLLVFIYNYWN